MTTASSHSDSDIRRRGVEPVRPVIAAVSDVSMGYGSPQLPSIMLSLLEKYGGEGVIIEPDIDGRTPYRGYGDSCRVERIYTMVGPHDGPGRVEYLLRAADRLNELRPDVLVLLCTFTVPVLFQLRERPPFVIFWSNESMGYYGPEEHETNRLLADKIDLVLFPEENRARMDGAAAGLLDTPTLIVYNVSDKLHPPQPAVPPDQRLGRILCAGTVSRTRTLADYLLEEDVSHLPIDVFGPIDPGEEESLLAAFYSRDSADGVSYKGVLGGPELARLRRHYAYSIVMWAPINDNQRYAAPNKFFEAIADGVPPIAAPHPQCETIINRYECGVLMSDWSIDAFRHALDRAFALLGTDDYAQMVRNCKRAYETELNWQTAFNAIDRLLPAAL